MAAANTCRKFEPNIFNKAKCQNCFKPKETHTAQALECNKQSRKISKCGYLFVAPESFDFTSPLDKSRRWQRRFFVLYDDGELTYSVDENVNTVPQGVIDMNICTDVHDAENSTSHQYSVCVKVPDKVVYIKGTTKDEINRWFDVLVMYPRSIKTKKHRRTPTYHGLKDTERAKRQRYHSTHVTPDQWVAGRNNEEEDVLMYDDENRPSRGLHRSRSDRGVNHSTADPASSSSSPVQHSNPIHYRGIRSLKHKHDKTYQDGLKKSSSLHDLSAATGEDGAEESWPRERMRSKSGDRPSSSSGDQHRYKNNAFRRRTDPHPIVLPRGETRPQQASRRSISPPARPTAGSLRQTFGERRVTAVTPDEVEGEAEDGIDAAEDAEQQTVAMEIEGQLRDADMDSQMEELYRSRSPTSSLLLNGRSKNETDERKMAKTMERDHSSPRHSPARPDDNIHDDLKYMKKGWLLKQRHSESDWVKHWFVLSGSTLCYYRDSRAEELDILDGMMDLTHCRGVAELDISRNYGFIVRTEDGDTMLSAMTSGIRTNWMQAIQKCIESNSTVKPHWPQSRVSVQNQRQVSMPERGITHPAFTQHSSQDSNPLAQSYPAAVKIKSKPKETTRVMPVGQESKALDLSASMGKDRSMITRRLTLDDYSSMSRRFNSEESLDRVGSQESLHSVTSEGSSQGQGHSGGQPVKRRRRRDKQHKHRISCTWPHQSGDGLNAETAVAAAQPVLADTTSQDSGSHSDLIKYIEEVDKDKKRSRELSPDEHSQLDEVERNIRKINRKSLTEFGQHHKPQHYDKFETGTAFAEGSKDPSLKMSLSERIMADYSREELQAMLNRSNTAPESSHIPGEASPGSYSSSSQARSSPRSQPDGTSPRSLQQEHLIASHALTSHSSEPERPSVGKVKEKQKAKPVSSLTVSSATSPPPAPVTSPLVSEADLIEGLFPPEGFADGNLHEIIEQKWKETEEDTLSKSQNKPKRKLESSGPALLKSPTSSMNDESTVVGLLEIEVESLKNKLDKTQRELTESQQKTAELNSTLKSTASDNKSTVTDMEKDQSRYLNQMNEIQDQMEHSTEFFQSKLAELENRNEMTKLQLNSLRSQLQDAKNTISIHQDEIGSLKSKLDQSHREVGQAKTVFSERINEREGEKQKLEQIIEGLEDQIHGLESDLQTHTTSLSKKDSDMAKAKERVRLMVKEIDEKTDRIEHLEGEIQEMLLLKQDEGDKDNMVSALTQELDISKQQLRAQDEVMHQQERDYTAKIKAMEDEFYGEKDKLEASLEQLKQRLGQVMHQSERTDAINLDMTDSMKERDQTIAQLEEKVIESDSKVEELKVELSGILQEHSETQKTLQESLSANSKQEADLENAKKECARVKHQLSSVNTDIQDMKVKKDKLVEDNQLLHQKVSLHEGQDQGQTEEVERLKTDIQKKSDKVQEIQDKYTEKCNEYEELASVVSEWEATYTNTKKELYEANQHISGLESQLKEVQSRQEQQLQSSPSSDNDADLALLVKQYKEEAQSWREEYEKQCEELERQSEDYTQAVERCEELVQVVGEVQQELKESQARVEGLEQSIEEERLAFHTDMEHKYQEVSKSEKALSDLRLQLSSTEQQIREQSTQLEKMRDREFLQQGGEREQSPSAGEEDLLQKYKDTLKDLKQTRKLLQETERKREELETANQAHKQKLQGVEMGYEDQVNQMRERISDLTNKLAASDRRLKRFNRRSSGPPEEELAAIEIQPDPELQARLVALESSLSEAEIKVTELAAVKQDLQVAQVKVKDMSTQILDQRCLEIDMAALKSSELNLRDKNTQLMEEVERMREEMSKVRGLSEEKDQQDIIGRLVEVEGRFSKVQDTLSDCQMKLLSLISELKTNGTCDYQSAGNVLETVKSGIDKLLSFGAKSKMYSLNKRDGCASAEDSVRIYAEKLALEAIVLGELAYNMKVNEVDVVVGYESVVYEMELAKHRLLTLEETLNTLDSQFSLNVCPKKSPLSEPSELSLEHLSRLLSQKLQLQHQVSEIVQNDKTCRSDVAQTRLPHSKDASVEEIGQETLFRIFMDDKLSESSQSSDLFPVKLFPQTVVHADLSHIQSKIRGCCKSSMSQNERQAFVQTELLSRYQLLVSQHRQTAETVPLFVNTCVDHLATMCTDDIVQLTAVCNAGNISRDVLSRVFDKEQIQSEMTLMVTKYIHSHNSASHADSSFLSESMKNRSGGVMDCVQKETSELCSKLLSAIDRKLQSVGDIECQILPDSERLQNLQQRNSIAMGLCNVVAQNALLGVQVILLELVISRAKLGDQACSSSSSDSRSELKLALKRNDSGVVVSSMSLPTSPVEQIHDKLITSIQQEAHSKSNLASYLLNNTANARQVGSASVLQGSGGLKEQVAKLACELVHIDSMVLQSNQSSTDYVDYLCREAVMQAQISYSTGLQKLQHYQEQEQLKQELESSYRIQKSKQEVQMSELEDEIDRLTILIGEHESAGTGAAMATTASQYEDEIKEKNKRFEQELQIQKENYERKMQSVLQELDVSKADSQTSLQESSKHQQSKLDKAQQQIQTQQVTIEKLESQLVSQQLASSRTEDEMRVAMKAAVSSEQVESLETENITLRQQLSEERDNHSVELQTLKEEIKHQTAAQTLLKSKIQELEATIQKLQLDYEQELTCLRSDHRKELVRSKDDMLNQLAAVEAESMHIDEDAVREKYMSEIDRIKSIYDKGFSSMEKSHQKVLIELRKSHKRELDTLRQEKDQVLAEETWATQAALDAMRKAHEAELQKERNKFLDMLAKTYSQADVESLQRQHEENLDLIQSEIRQLSEQYSIKLLENVSLEKKVEVQLKALHDSRRRVQELMMRNEELNSHLRHEIETLKNMVSPNTCPLSPVRKESEPPETYQLKVALRIKDTEMLHMQDELKQLKEQLQNTSQELEDSVEKYHELYTDHQTAKKQHVAKIQSLEQALEQATSLPECIEIADSPREGQEPSESTSRTSLFTSMADSMENNTSDSADSCAEKSPHLLLPSPRAEFTSSPDRSSSSASSQHGASALAAGASGRQLPKVAPEARSMKRSLWRERQPERARSNPGPVPLNIPVFSLPPKHQPGQTKGATSTSSLERSRKKKPSKMASVDIIEEL